MPKRIFISFAIEDSRYRDFLVGQARNNRSPFQFVDMSVKEPWEISWKIRCRSKIKGCDGVIALISSNTPSASGALWEINCAKEEKIPVLGIYVSANNRLTRIPNELSNVRISTWTWEEINRFIESL